MITVQDILEIPDLNLRLLAGAKSASNPIRWVHITEVPDPTRWLKGGELLLTTGYGFALQDRLGNNLLDMDTTVDANSYLVIRLNPDYNPQPRLTIESLPADVKLRWLAVYSNFALMNNTDLRTTNWNQVGITPSVENTDLVVTSPAIGSEQFYRLQK